ncbi:MAG: glycogen debranching protein [Bacteroidetes bacterium]|jgi:hypothetical protein|nr:glycogen debranching protein [Bacteroidota bacterium]
MKFLLPGLVAVLIAFPFVSSLHAQEILYRSDAFTVTDRSVQEGGFEAIVESPTRMRSNYLYAAGQESKQVAFKFALNGEDNEAPPGQDHLLFFDPQDTSGSTPIYRFGEELIKPYPQLPGRTVTIRLDLRPVLRAFETTGQYTPPYGEPIAAEDFEGVYVAGSMRPLTWDFNALTEQHRLTDSDGDGIYDITLTFDSGTARPFDDEGYAVWTLSQDLSGLPEYASGRPLLDAMHTLSLEEMLQDVQDDGTFMAGAKWPGVWTRDVSYSIVLALALLAPEVSKQSLLAKVDDAGRIVQDTGTGGSWPISTDRMTWALAAWELYVVTGDADWVQTAYDVIRRSAEADLVTAREAETGLFYGESSFLDWREQTYPRWMDPKDIYQSQALGTNVVHYATYRILADMAEALGEPSARWDRIADEVQDGLNTYLWQPDAGTYGQYRYGRLFPSLSPRAETLGAALAVLYGAATPEQRERILASVPQVPYGVPCIAPQIPGIPPYHNDGIWPFVVAYWTWAGAEGGNTAVVEHGMASIYRAAALFLTNKENMVARTGDFEGTQVNSDRQLWSVAGNLATVYRVLFGMRFSPDGLQFEPFVPEAYAGPHTLTGVTYRDAVLDITVDGFGSEVTSATLDGEPLEAPFLPADLQGRHTLVLTLDGEVPASHATMRPVQFTPPMPIAEQEGGELRWSPVEDAAAYAIHRNGERIAVTTDTSFALPEARSLSAYQMQALGTDGLASFLSAPLRVAPEEAVLTVQPDGELEQHYEGYTGEGYVTLSTARTTPVTVTVEIAEAGTYALDARYANGEGPVNTDNKAAIRTLLVDGERAGTLVFPQRGDGAWTDWGSTNALRLTLTPGRHTFTLDLRASDENMNRSVNRALLDHLRLVPMAAK